MAAGADEDVRREIADATRSYRRAQAVADERRKAMLRLTVRRIVERRITKSEAARITGYTREYLTNLAKDSEYVPAASDLPHVQ